MVVVCNPSEAESHQDDPSEAESHQDDILIALDGGGEEKAGEGAGALVKVPEETEPLGSC